MARRGDDTIRSSSEAAVGRMGGPLPANSDDPRPKCRLRRRVCGGIQHDNPQGYRCARRLRRAGDSVCHRANTDAIQPGTSPVVFCRWRFADWPYKRGIGQWRTGDATPATNGGPPALTSGLPIPHLITIDEIPRLVLVLVLRPSSSIQVFFRGRGTKDEDEDENGRNHHARDAP